MLCCCRRNANLPDKSDSGLIPRDQHHEDVDIGNSKSSSARGEGGMMKPEPLIKPHEVENLQNAAQQDSVRALTTSRRLSELAAGLPYVDASLQNTPIPPRRYPLTATKYVVDVAPSPPKSQQGTPSHGNYLTRMLNKNGHDSAGSDSDDKTRLLGKNGGGYIPEEAHPKLLLSQTAHFSAASNGVDQNGFDINGDGHNVINGEHSKEYDDMLRNSVKMCNQLQTDLEGYIQSISPSQSHALNNV